MKLSLNKQEISLALSIPKKEQVIAAKINKKLWLIITILLVILGTLAWWFYFQQGLTLAYNDARSHLNVARRVVDSLQPGAAQIGSVWLPLYHILMLPLIWNDYLWHTGIAGSAISMASFVLGGLYLVGVTKKLKFSLPATLITLLIYILNPNLIFLQSTPMTESLLIFLTIATTYYLLDWVESFNILSLIGASFFTFMAALTRYDGWFLLAFVGVCVAIVSYNRRGKTFAEGNFILFCTLAAFGVFLWFLWNLLIFGDPLYFILGPFSAKAQQDILQVEGRLLTKGNIFYSFFIYLFAVRHNIGIWLGSLFVLGIWTLFKSDDFSKNTKYAISILLSPFIFNVLSLYLGHSVIHLPEIPPYTWFNDRYGLMMLPAAALAIGFLANSRKKMIILLISIVVFLQSSLMYVGNKIITIEDGVRGSSGEFLDEAGNWIKDNVESGLILVAASSNDALLFRSGLPLKQFITEGAQKYWNESLEEPTKYAEWIIMHKGDLVDKRVRNNKLFLNNFKLVYHDEFSYIYKKDLNTNQPLTEAQLP